MPSRDVVLSHPVRTAIGTFNGTLKGTPATELGAAVVRETLRALGPRSGAHRQRGHGQRHPGRQPHEPGAAGRDQRRRSGRRAGADRQSRLRLRRAGDRLGGAGDLARPCRCRDRRRHGEHGPGAVPVCPAGAGVTGWAMREIYDSMLRDGLNDAFSGEHSGWHTEDLVARHEHHARGPGSLGGALAAALRRRAGGGTFRGGNRRRRSQGHAKARRSSMRTRRTGPERRSRCSPS